MVPVQQLARGGDLHFANVLLAVIYAHGLQLDQGRVGFVWCGFGVPSLPVACILP